MHIFVQSEILREGFNKILSVVDKKSSRPLLTNCLIIAKENHLELVATDLEVSAKIQCPADIRVSGELCINAKNISDILRELPNNQIELKKDPSDGILRLSCQDINFSLVVANPSEFPRMNFVSSLNSFEIAASKLLVCVDKISHAISSDETRPFLNGLFLQILDSKLRAVAVDGYRLALLDIEEFNGSHKILEDGIIIPRKGVYELKKLAESHSNETIKISVDDSFIYANVGEKYSIFIRLIAREFPKYQAHIPTKTSFSFSADKNVLVDAIKRVKILANEKTNGIKFILSSNKLVISATHSVFGEAVEAIEIDYAGNDISIGFNAKYVLDTLSVLPETDITFEFNNELNPVLVKSIELPLFLGIVMPLKL